MGIKGLAKGFASLQGKSQSCGAVLAGGQALHSPCKRDRDVSAGCTHSSHTGQCRGQRAAATLTEKEHPPAQSTSLHGSAFIESLANLTNFEEKSSCPQAAETAVVFAKPEGGCL